MVRQTDNRWRHMLYRQILHFFQILRFPKVIAAIKAAYVPTLMAPLKKQILAFFGILEWLGKLTIDGATCYITYNIVEFITPVAP